MSSNGAGPSGSLQRPKQQSASRKSAVTRATPELIIIDSSDESEPKPTVVSKNATPRSSEIINIHDSDSDPANEPQKPVFPLLVARKSTSAVPGTSRLPFQPRPRPRPRPTLSKSAPAVVEQTLPPLPSSSDVENGTKASSESPAVDSPQARGTSTIPGALAHRAAPNPEPSSDVDSRSSGDMVETELIIDGPPETSVVLGSDGSSGSDGVPQSAVLDSERLNPQAARGRSSNTASPRKRAPIKSSPSQTSGSHSDHAETLTEPELEVSIAQVSIHDHQPNPPEATDMDYADTVAAVEDIALDDRMEPGPSEPAPSRSISVSSGETGRSECSVSGCSAKFSSTGQRHTHMSRDHGIRLSLDNKPPNKGKRKANTTLPTSTRKRIAIVGSEGQADRLSVAPHSSSSNSDNSQRYVERSNTVGFDSFAQNLPDREDSSLPIALKP
ncbi:hypothetical protein BDV93DRAFT_370487 [Ceratobasidium sp. AG-I]|nr:hypothetical protein BDV93DRAFT_370487 [Ceratobasidium sp. AG-I]